MFDSQGSDIVERCEGKRIFIIWDHVFSIRETFIGNLQIDQRDDESVTDVLALSVLEIVMQSPESAWHWVCLATSTFYVLFSWPGTGRQGSSGLSASIVDTVHTDSMGRKWLGKGRTPGGLLTSTDILKHLWIVAHTWSCTLCKMYAEHGHVQM